MDSVKTPPKRSLLSVHCSPGVFRMTPDGLGLSNKGLITSVALEAPVPLQRVARTRTTEGQNDSLVALGQRWLWGANCEYDGAHSEPDDKIYATSKRH